MRKLEAADIFCAPVYNYAQVTNDDQTDTNGYLTKTEHPKLGDTRVVSCPIDFKATPADSSRPEPSLGGHTEEVLHQFGYAAAEVQGLRNAGVV